jgi:hypothetical protein
LKVGDLTTALFKCQLVIYLGGSSLENGELCLWHKAIHATRDDGLEELSLCVLLMRIINICYKIEVTPIKGIVSKSDSQRNKNCEWRDLSGRSSGLARAIAVLIINCVAFEVRRSEFRYSSCFKNQYR